MAAYLVPVSECFFYIFSTGNLNFPCILPSRYYIYHIIRIKQNGWPIFSKDCDKRIHKILSKEVFYEMLIKSACLIGIMKVRVTQHGQYG